jgi:hypothetical protein
VVLGIEARASCMRGKHITTELYPQPTNSSFPKTFHFLTLQEEAKDPSSRISTHKNVADLRHLSEQMQIISGTI